MASKSTSWVSEKQKNQMMIRIYAKMESLPNEKQESKYEVFK